MVGYDPGIAVIFTITAASRAVRSRDLLGGTGDYYLK
jgi:hypothetical protein